MTSAGPTCRSAAMAGSAMLAIAVSSEAIASAVKIAAAAQFRRSAGRPSLAAGLFAEIVSVDIPGGSPDAWRCSANAGGAAGGSLHDAYARRMPARRLLRLGPVAAAGGCAASGGFCQGFARPLTHELLERLRRGAADLFDRIGHREARPLGVEAGGAERLPERGQMCDRVGIVTAGDGVAAPLLVGGLLVAHVPGQHAAESRNDVLQRDDAPDHRIGRISGQAGAGHNAARTP